MIHPPADPRRSEKLAAFDRLLTTMDELRLNCPWDAKQTNETLRHLTIEEVYELAESILAGDPEEIKKELGDVLLHIVFYSRIAYENQQFDIADVIHSICDKLVHRHPHIYSDTVVSGEDEVKRNWEALKKKEGNKSTLSGVPSSLPPMIKAMRIQEKARGAGFDWEKKEQVWEKVQEELGEFLDEVNHHTPDLDRAEKELGDVFFSLINYARFLGLNPDQALERTNLKFIQRFGHIEKRAGEIGKSLTDMTLAEMDVYWEEAKSIGLK
ncbi:MAG TPA: nucleoside triphosphate pyrophosphohydrolase [Catalimonadaceae bacterium]|nr:nucleoside triphosphate pyrophosphohydrolase [Catalimonadaceae bacterium]